MHFNTTIRGERKCKIERNRGKVVHESCIWEKKIGRIYAAWNIGITQITVKMRKRGKYKIDQPAPSNGSVYWAEICTHDPAQDLNSSVVIHHPCMRTCTRSHTQSVTPFPSLAHWGFRSGSIGRCKYGMSIDNGVDRSVSVVRVDAIRLVLKGKRDYFVQKKKTITYS